MHVILHSKPLLFKENIQMDEFEKRLQLHRLFNGHALMQTLFQETFKLFVYPQGWMEFVDNSEPFRLAKTPAYV